MLAHKQKGLSMIRALRGLSAVLVICATALAPQLARATTIDFDARPEGGQSWLFDYAVINDTLSEPIGEFTLFFDHQSFANLARVSVPDGWGLSDVFQPDPGLPDDGFFDALADPGFEIAPGASLGGFRIRFDYFGAGAPGAQLFTIVRPDTLPLELIESGMTRARETPVSVAEPSPLVLFATAMLLLLAVAGYRRLLPGRFGQWAAALAGLTLFASPSFAALVVGNTTLVSSQRVTRTQWDYTFRLSATNTGPDAKSVRATVTSGSPHTTVLESELVFGDMGASATALSQDTFTVRHDRSFPFSMADLTVRFRSDLALVPHLEPAHASEAIIGDAGGVLEAVASDGTRFTLTVPAQAIQSPEPIRLTATPVAGIDGLPVSGGFRAAVQFGPQGLVLSRPATLRIELPAGFLATTLAAFGYADAGEHFAFHPIFPGDLDPVGSALTLRVTHFSGYGAAEATSEDIAAIGSQATGTESFANEVARILKELAERGIRELTPEAVAALRSVLQGHFNSVVAPGLQNAATFAQIQQAVGQFVAWLATVQGIPGLDAIFQGQASAAQDMIQAKLDDLFEKLNQRCLNETNLCSRGAFLQEFQKALVIGQQLLDSGGLPTLGSFCEGLMGKLPQELVVLPSSLEVGFGDNAQLSAVMRGFDNGTLALSHETLVQLGFQWSVSPDSGIDGDPHANPLSGRAVKDGPLTVTARACGLSATAKVDTKIDITGFWSGSGTESVVCPDPDRNETSSGPASVPLTQSGTSISGGAGDLTITGSITPGKLGAFTVNGSFSGDDDRPFTATFTGSGSVFGKTGTLNVQWNGSDIGEEPCTFSGNGTAQR